MTEVKLSPAETIARKRDCERKLTPLVSDAVFVLGVEEAAKKFGIKPEEAVKLTYKNLRKGKDFDKFEKLLPYDTLTVVCDKIVQLGSLSEVKIMDNCKKVAKNWEIIVARYIFKERLKRENIN